MCLLSALSVRLLQLEAFYGESLSAEARSHYEYKETLHAQRGRIFDREGELLARSQTVFSLVADPYHLQDPGQACIGLATRDKQSPQAVRKRYLPAEVISQYRSYVAESIAKVLRVPAHEISRSLKESDGGPVILARNIEDDFARQIEKLLDEKNLRGLYLKRGERRYYPSPLSLTQVIGYVDEDGNGVSGIEKTFNEEMLGAPGYRYCERDRKRREILAYRGLQVEPVPGKDVYLTIDMALQASVERELDGIIDRFRPEKVTAIWMNPKSGEVLAMASRPHFDLATREGIRGMDPLRRNPAVTDLYQPGSTFKVVGYGGAFDRGLASPSSEVNCHQGNYTLDGYPLKDHHPYGHLTARMAFAKSSNIGAYLIARPLNKDVYHHYMGQFGFGRETGIELTAEARGKVFPVKEWSRTSFSSQVIGYEVAVTPIQMVMACSVIANKGVYLPPTMISGTMASDREATLKKSDLRARRRVISEKAADQVKVCMMDAMMDTGTGSKGRVAGFSVAGKTGTARKHIENVGYAEGRYIVSFMGFLPANDPELVGLIVIDDPRVDGKEVYGGSVAAPVFKSISEDAVKILNIKPDKPEELLAEDEAKLAAITGE